MPAFTSRLLIPLFCLESVGGDWPGQPCTSQADCKYAGCSDFEFHVCDVWDGDGDGIDQATYRCIRGTTTSACSGKPNGHGYEDSDGRGWCWDGRKDEWCPLSSQDTCSGSTFTFHAERKSWHAARDTCRERSGDLASIHSAAENDEAYALGRGQEVWLGLNGEEREDVWVWSDGSPMDYKHWAPGEPNNYGGDEDCGGYWSGRAMASPEKPKGWDSLGGGASCSAEYPFICRRSPPARRLCVRIVTSSGDAADGSLDVAVDEGSGYSWVTTGRAWAKGENVYAQCYAALTGVQLRNPSRNGWIGTVEYSRDGGVTYDSFLCAFGCTANPPPCNKGDCFPGDMVVDGDRDGIDYGQTSCLDGATCTFSLPLALTPETL